MSGTLLEFYQNLTPAGARLHWYDAECPARGEVFLGTITAEHVTCPICVLIMQAKGQGSDYEAERLEFERRHEEAYQAERRQEAVEAAERKRIRNRAEVREAVRRTEHREARERFYARETEEQRQRARNRRGYADSESIKSRDRRTHLTELQQALDGWPDVDWNDTWDAVRELQADRRQDAEHWTDLRRFQKRGELRF